MSPVVGKVVCVQRVVLWVASTGEAIIDIAKHLILSLALTQGSCPWLSATRKLTWWGELCHWPPICSPLYRMAGSGEGTASWDRWALYLKPYGASGGDSFALICCYIKNTHACHLLYLCGDAELFGAGHWLECCVVEENRKERKKKNHFISLLLQ